MTASRIRETKPARTMRERLRAMGLREIRLVVPDARQRTVRERVAAKVARLNKASEEDALDWIEAVSDAK